MRRLRNWALIALWEFVFLIQSIPYLFKYKKRRGPDFIIIGAAKAGTTFLYKQLSKHPRIKEARMKEPRFFSRYYFLGKRYYISYFPVRKTSELSGEATASYFYNKMVPVRLKRHFPEVKLIVLLRNPVERAYSHFQMNKSDERNSSFIEALKKEKEGKINYHYLQSSQYMENLRLWFQYFPKEQFLILKSEKLFQNPEPELKKLFHFLGLEKSKLSGFQKVNHRDYQPLRKEEYNQAWSFFDSDMKELERELGVEFKWEAQQ